MHRFASNFSLLKLKFFLKVTFFKKALMTEKSIWRAFDPSSSNRWYPNKFLESNFAKRILENWIPNFETEYFQLWVKFKNWEFISFFAIFLCWNAKWRMEKLLSVNTIFSKRVLQFLVSKQKCCKSSIRLKNEKFAFSRGWGKKTLSAN